MKFLRFFVSVLAAATLLAPIAASAQEPTLDAVLARAGGLLVPVRMREHYDIRSDGSRVEGDASYSRFRQFQVKVDEKLAPVIKQ
jgi:hypothetical protein